jgi:hypothetical protein
MGDAVTNQTKKGWLTGTMEAFFILATTID